MGTFSGAASGVPMTSHAVPVAPARLPAQAGTLM